MHCYSLKRCGRRWSGGVDRIEDGARGWLPDSDIPAPLNQTERCPYYPASILCSLSTEQVDRAWQPLSGYSQHQLPLDSYIV